MAQLEMVRGTTYTLALTLTDSTGAEYILSAGQVLRFGLKKAVSQAAYSVVKELTAADYDTTAHGYNITLLPSDTEGLAFGGYVFDVGLQLGEDSYMQVVPVTTLQICDNVTKRSVDDE